MKCHICNCYRPLTGCNHYYPDSEAVLKNAGYTIVRLKTKVKVIRGKERHSFADLFKAALVLIHNPQTQQP